MEQPSLNPASVSQLDGGFIPYLVASTIYPCTSGSPTSPVSKTHPHLSLSFFLPSLISFFSLLPPQSPSFPHGPSWSYLDQLFCLCHLLHCSCNCIHTECTQAQPSHCVGISLASVSHHCVTFSWSLYRGRHRRQQSSTPAQGHAGDAGRERGPLPPSLSQPTDARLLLEFTLFFASLLS